MGDFPYIEWLARSYKKKGERSRNWTDYLKAHGLANYCLDRDSTEERCRLVYDVENSWYKGKHPLSYEGHQELTKEHEQLLNTFREDMKNHFDSLRHEELSFTTDDIFCDTTMSELREFSEAVFAANKVLSDRFVAISKTFMESSVDILRRADRLAPCNFAVIGLGSVAKGEASPYSDLEYAFIVDKDADYFTMLAMDNYFRIGNFRQTPLTSFDIEELKDESGRGSLMPFIIDNTKIGYRIDGITERSGNIPTGNGHAKGIRLIKTVEDFMELYKTSSELPFAGMADKSDILSSSVLIYSNEGDTSEIHLRFLDRIKDELDSAQQNKKVNRRRIDSFLRDLEVYTFLPTFTKYQPPKNLDIKVKTDIFRYPTLLANNIKMCVGFSCMYPWETYYSLRMIGVLSDENYYYICTILALSIYIRTLAYLHQDQQAEHVILDPYNIGPMKSLYRAPVDLFIIIGYLLIPIKHSIEYYVKDEKEIARDISRSMNDFVMSMMKSIHVDKTEFMAKTEVRYFCGTYLPAKRELNKGLGAAIESVSCDRFVELVHQKCPEANCRRSVELASYLLYYTGEFASAMDYFQWLINHQKAKTGFWKLLTAHCMKEMGNYRSARQMLNEVKEYQSNDVEMAISTDSYDMIQTSYDVNTNHQDIAVNYTDIGNAYFDMGEYDEALLYHTRGLKMNIAMYDDTGHPNIATDYNNIGNGYNGIGNYSEAIEHFTKSLEILKSVYGTDADHPDIAARYNNIGIVFRNMGEYTLALQHCFKALYMWKAVYGEKSSHPNIANCYNNIGGNHDDEGEFEEALKYYTLSLDMQQGMYGTEANHPDIATSYNNIGVTYTNLGKYEAALQHHLKSLEMREAVYGKKTNHPDIANSYDNIGMCYMQMGDSNMALKHCIESMEIRQSLFGENSTHSDIADSYNNIGLIYNSGGEFPLALQFHMKSLEMRKVIYVDNDNHPDIASSYNNIGNTYVDMEEYAAALVCYARSLRMQKAVHGVESNHPDIAGSYNNIGTIHCKMGNYTESLEPFAKSIEMRKTLYGELCNHPEIVSSYNNLARAYRYMGKYAEALENYSKLLTLTKATHGADTPHPDLVDGYTRIGNTYSEMGRHSVAVKHYMKALEINKTLYGATDHHCDIASSYNNIGNAYRGLGECSSALNHYHSALEMENFIHGAGTNHHAKARCCNNIAETYYVMGEYTAALNFCIMLFETMRNSD